jgi:hypothetical protein
LFKKANREGESFEFLGTCRERRGLIKIQIYYYQKFKMKAV